MKSPVLNCKPQDNICQNLDFDSLQNIKGAVGLHREEVVGIGWLPWLEIHRVRIPPQVLHVF